MDFFKQIISWVRETKIIGQLFELLTKLSHGTGSQFAIFLSEKVLFYAGKLYFPIKFSNLMKFFVVDIASEYPCASNPQSFYVNIELFCIAIPISLLCKA